MAMISWTEDPRDVLYAVRAHLLYLGESITPRDKTARALYAKAMQRARLLLNVRGRKGYWTLNPKWRQRLELAGVDPDTLEVVNQGHWDLAWQMLQRFDFKIAQLQQRITLGDSAPPAAEVEVNVPARNPGSNLPTKPLKRRAADPLALPFPALEPVTSEAPSGLPMGNLVAQAKVRRLAGRA